MLIFIISIIMIVAEMAMIAAAGMPYVVPGWVVTVTEVVYFTSHIFFLIYVVELQDRARFYKRKWEEEKCRRD